MARNEDMVKLDNLLARAASQAKLMGLRSVVTHALFVVTHQALGGEAANRLLHESGVDAVAYCQKLFTELTAMPRVKRYEGEIPVHEATRRILENVEKRIAGTRRPEVAPYRTVFEELLRADGVLKETDECDPFAELEGLIGLGSVKEEVRRLVELVKFNQARQAKGLGSESLTHHFIFTGNPGTGKTTVARIIAGIYKKLGVLRKGHLVEVDRAKLIAGYIGQSDAKTEAVINEALDGVLFIDEAYSLTAAGRSDYGRQVVEILLKRMDDLRDRLVVIAAGYGREMQEFVAFNPGLESRFTKYIDFPDYSADEMVQIFASMAKAKENVLSDAAAEHVRRRVAQEVGSGRAAKGNARFVRNLFKETTERMATRVMAGGRASKRDLQLIEAEDVPWTE